MRNYFIRWRHSKGYGVHSPFAYRFVTDVLRPGPYQYYSYWEAEALLEGNECNDYKFQKLVRFVIRLAIFLKVKEIKGLGKTRRLAEICSLALNLSNTSFTSSVKHSPNNKYISGDSQFSERPLNTGKSLVIVKGTADFNFLKDCLKNNSSILALNPDNNMRNFMKSPLERGLLLEDRNMMILIPRDEMAYIAYDIRIKV